MTIKELNEYFLEHNYASYDRTNYDNFLEEVKFNFPLKSIHITGTNGKGSTANFLYNIYLAAGYKVGLYTSPFAYSVTEMVNVNGKTISGEEYIALFSQYQPLFEKHHLSSFEMQTFIAYQYFLKENLDIVIIEVGMGGFIDATNVIKPILSIISNVSLEHTSYLGRSISEIAFNKAGIIKEEGKALVGKVDDSALFAIKEYAKSLHSLVNLVSDYHNEHLENNEIVFDYYPYKNLKLKTNAMYQCENASLAVEAIKLCSDVLPVNEESIKNGLYCSSLMCRYDFAKPNLLLDGAHNPDGINKLVKSLENEQRPIHVVFASFKDKNIELMLISLGLISDDVTLTTFPHKRARTEEDYFLYLGDYSFVEDYHQLISDKLTQYPDDLVLVTGSLAFTYLVKKEF